MIDRIIYKNDFIDFNVGKCINRYSGMSASGKTYLPVYVSTFEKFPRIISFMKQSDYDDFMRNPWESGTNVIYFFDRLDVFATNEILLEINKNPGACCLLDIKNISKLLDLDIEFRDIMIMRKTINMIEVKDGFYTEDNMDMAISKLLSTLLNLRYCDSNTNLLSIIKNTKELFNVYF